jgi:hypothetical protein
MIAACLFVATELHRTGASRPVPEELGKISGIRFHRQELERQLAVYERAWTWLFAFTPGLIVLLAGAVYNSSNVSPDSRRLLGVFVVAGGWVPIVLWVRRRNASRAARLRGEIAKLVEAESEP